VLGSTGSIGRQTLETAALFPDRLQVVALAAQSDAAALAEQVARFRPDAVALTRGAAGEIGGLPAGAGPEALVELATRADVDTVVVAVVGAAGLPPTMAALRAGKTVALATKEVLVIGGALVMEAARAGSGAVLPIDSEHSAILQCLRGARREDVARILLTASGGPFVDASPAAMAAMTPEQALRHPTWRMGPKITIDSATLMNKGLEMIEARWLFDLPPSAIEIVVHRQSIIHSLVEFRDGSTLAQLSLPDMRLPIQYALLYPDRPPNPWPRLDLTTVGSLTFERPAPERFPCLRLAYEAAEVGGTMPAVMSAANEAVVDHFLRGRIPFGEIAPRIERVMRAHQVVTDPAYDAIIHADAWARQCAGGD
jgi:1-deoxy-D-xylulose-5-phosphate reductoisomerase